ncbi:MAG: hypothetical protein MK193_10295 [Lentisphaeria bacterium]|nr:hypothetical protein [Lentisphaeria bacterium]
MESRSIYEWIDEITEIWQVMLEISRETELSERELYILAPKAAIRKRDLPFNELNNQLAQESALSSYQANLKLEKDLEYPIYAFSFCYIMAHFGLNKIDEKQAQNLLNELMINKQILYKRTSPLY